MEQIIQLLKSIQPQDFVDIALLSAIIYWLLLLIKGTRTIPILVGLTVLLGAYGGASFLELDAIGWLMDNLFASFVVILVVLFQADIRNALAQVGMTTMLREGPPAAQEEWIAEVVRAANIMARKRIGGTIVLERETGLRNFVERGKVLNADPTAELLESIFHTSSPLHDGAVIITRQGKLAAARCILPLSMNPATSAFLGTRHRSALGLTEETDAVVVVVSEERGFISVAYRGKLQRNLDEQQVRARITQILQGTEQQDAHTPDSAPAQIA